MFTKLTDTSKAAIFTVLVLSLAVGAALLIRFILAHDLEGSIQAQGWIYMGVWCAVAIGLVVFDWKAWRGTAPALAKTVLPAPSREATPAASA